VEVVHDLSKCPSSIAGHAVTIGTYDGVHVGHQAVIRATKLEGQRLDVPMAVVTFDPHPASVLRPETAPLLLTDLEQKIELLDHFGVDTAVVVPFDEVRATETADEFIEKVLVGCVGAKTIVVGQDFHFGRDRAGNVDLLAEAGVLHGFEVHGVDLLPRPDGTIESVSSTAIRRSLAGGDVETAAQLLGRYHEVRGPVVRV